jgi:hypothetical protein
MRDTQTENSKVLRDFCGTHPCSPVLDACNGRPTHRFSINSSPTESNSYHTALYTRFAASAAGQPLQGECRRFEPVSTHQNQYVAILITFHVHFLSTISRLLRLRKGVKSPDGKTLARRPRGPPITLKLAAARSLAAFAADFGLQVEEPHAVPQQPPPRPLSSGANRRRSLTRILA